MSERAVPKPLSENSVPLNLLRSDAFLDRVLDHLDDRAAHPLNLARWDLKFAIEKTIAEVYRP